MCRSTNRQAEPEVWFRIVHVSGDSRNSAPVVAYREQMVEIALGPKGGSEYGNTDTLTRRVPADTETWPAPCRTAMNGIGGYPTATR